MYIELYYRTTWKSSPHKTGLTTLASLLLTFILTIIRCVKYINLLSSHHRQQLFSVFSFFKPLTTHHKYVGPINHVFELYSFTPNFLRMFELFFWPPTLFTLYRTKSDILIIDPSFLRPCIPDPWNWSKTKYVLDQCFSTWVPPILNWVPWESSN